MSILRSNAPVRELFGDLFGSAPRLAGVVAQRPHVLDAAIDPGRVGAIGDSLDEARLEARVAEFLDAATSFEGMLDRARDFAAEEMFLIGRAPALRRARPRAGGARLQRAGAEPGRGAARPGLATPSRAITAGCRGGRVAASPWASSARAR